jgi:acetoin:2,6-dichlorophenolindophenol oxidoreductase subunit beta
MTVMTMTDAIDAAIAAEMRTDPSVLVFGEGTATKQRAMLAEFGPERVRNTPLAEGIIAGTAAGAAAAGLRPVIDLLFAPFLTYAMDEIVNSAGKLRFLSGGQFAFPMVVLARTGAGWGVGGQHNHNVEAWFAHAPGLKVVMPSTAEDAHGLMRAAIRDPNPVLFFADLALAFAPGEVSGAAIPLGQAAVRRSGRHVSLIAYAKTVHSCLEAAARLAEQGIEAEVIDLRTIKPLDEATILASVRRTGRAIVVHEASRICGVGAEVAAIIAEKAFGALKAPVLRLTGPDAPTAGNFALEAAFAPQVDDIIAASRALLDPVTAPDRAALSA